MPGEVEMVQSLGIVLESTHEKFDFKGQAPMRASSYIVVTELRFKVTKWKVCKNDCGSYSNVENELQNRYNVEDKECTSWFYANLTQARVISPS